MQLEEQAALFIKKIKRYLIFQFGKLLEEASLEEFYLAFCFVLREQVMANWTACLHTFSKKKDRILYYLSMEYLPGRLLGNNINHIGALDLVKKVLEKTNRTFSDFLELEPDPGLGNGGLGRLASCFLDSLATQEYPCWGYGLRYQYGIFDQEIWDGSQIERPDCWLLQENPWEFRRDNDAAAIYFRGNPVPGTNSHGDEVFQLEDFEEVRALPYDTPIIGYPKKNGVPVLSLRLWTTKESPRNFELQRYNAGKLDQAAENTSLTDVLYPNDHHDAGKRIRLKQEFLLVSASLQDIIKRHLKIHETLDNFAEKVRIQINDTHPSLVIAELTRRLVKNHDIAFDKAWEITQTCCSYTNHTILKEALEEWNEERVSELLPRQYKMIQKLNFRFCTEVRNKFPGQEEKLRKLSFIETGQIKMAHLSIYGSHKVNGVAHLHTEILKKRVFPEFYEMYPEKFLAITNGVTQRRWLLYANPALAELISSKIGSEWTCNFEAIRKLEDFAEEKTTQEAFLQIKKENKKKLISFLKTENPLRDYKGKIIGHFFPLEENALFDVQIKRIHEYKRPLLNILHIIMLYQEIKEKKRKPIPRLFLFAGKAAPGYEIAKKIIRLIYAIARKINDDPDTQNMLRVVFVENYNVSKAQVIIPAADLSEQISLAGKEASGTGNMKLSMNGSLTIGTLDGANIEMEQEVKKGFWPFSFGSTEEEIEKIKHDYNPRTLYEKEEKIKKAVDTLKDGFFAQNEGEKEAFYHLYQSLLEGNIFERADRYFVLQDLLPYYETQKKVEELYRDPLLWAKFALYNIAGMGKFSTDTSIKKYAKEVWGLTPSPCDPEILNKLIQACSDVS